MPETRTSRTGIPLTLRTKDEPYFSEWWGGFEAGRVGWPQRGQGTFAADETWSDEELAAWDEGYEEGKKLNLTGALRHGPWTDDVAPA